jgi:hypothetical protein
MPAKLVLIDSGSGTQLHNEKYTLYGKDRILAITTPQKAHGVFKTADYTVQGTVEQVSTRGAGSIELTDIVLSFQKKGSGHVTLNFHDGTVTVPIIGIDLTDAPVSTAVNFTGRWQGWASAHIDVVISGADSVGTVAIGYIHHNDKGSLSYSEWNSLR